MIRLPEWLNHVRIENSAAKAVRRISHTDDAPPGEILAAAQLIISHFQEIELADAPSLYEEASAIPLIAAARALDSLSQAPNISQTIRIDLCLTAASAFALYGNFPSATACLRRARTVTTKDTYELQSLIQCTLAPSLLPTTIHKTASGTREYLSFLNAFLDDGREEHFKSAQALLTQMIPASLTSFEGGLMRSCRTVLSHIWHLSTARLLKIYNKTLPEAYARQLVAAGVKTLLPPQRKALVEQSLVGTKNNRLISLPTSTGKTLLGEWSLVASLQGNDDIACYVAPYVALGRQVVEAFISHLSNSYRVISLIPGSTFHNKSVPKTGQCIIVATPERFDLLLRSLPELKDRLRCIVVDEAHLIENDTRGARLEGLLARLRLLQQRNVSFSIVLLSAVLPSYDTLKAWMGISDSDVITNSWRPTARRLAFWRSDGKLSWHYGGDPIRNAGTRGSEQIGSRIVLWPHNNFYPARNFGQIRQQQPAIHSNIAHLVNMLLSEFGGPILCVCSSKEGARRLANAIAAALPSPRELPQSILNLISYITNQYPHLSPLATLLSKQVAYHNSVLPHDLREMIEDGVKSKEIVAVASTTTLAEGIDLPFRFSLIADWLVWRDAKQAPMSALLFRNIAGRCGRAGVFTEGDIVVIDNPVGEASLVSPVTRSKLQAQIFFADGPSHVSSAMEEASQVTLNSGVRAEIASQFLAAIPENPREEDLVTAFANNSLAGQRLHRTKVIDMLQEMRATFLDPTHGAMAVANSPLRLTPLGESANMTGFSPSSCRKIISVLRTMQPPSDVKESARFLLLNLGLLPEQQNADWRKALENPRARPIVKPIDLDLVLQQWLNGHEEQDIFVTLSSVRGSQRDVSAEDWRTGKSLSADWDSSFDKFFDFKSNVLQNFTPWVMRACKALSGEVKGWTENASWDLWSDMLEYGVDSRWAVEAVRRKAPVSRRMIAEVGKLWPPELCSDGDMLGVSNLAASRAVQVRLLEIIRTTSTQTPQSILSLKEAETLFDWLLEQPPE